jgi:PAS domain S-box-containing protein
MLRIPQSRYKNRPKNSKRSTADDILCHLAFDNSLHANIISTASNGKIILANKAAGKLLGYAKEELLTKNRSDIFDIHERSFINILHQRTAEGQFIALVTAVKKSGKLLPCEITSAVFMADDVEMSIITISDLSESILKQKNIDIKKEKIVADDIVVAQEKSDARLTKNNEKLEQEIKLKKMQIAEATEDAKGEERSDIGKELHDNVNQLLSASKLYLDMAKQGGVNSKMYISRSSEYTLIAIEEIRKLTFGLTTNIINNLGLCKAISNIIRDTMEVNPIKISSMLESFIEDSVNDKFKLNIYRIIQEQLNNILKHAKATKVTINLSQTKKSTILVISDNGVGFDTAKKRKGIGVDNIKSRATSYNGIADFNSQPNKGCVLTVTFPITEPMLNNT